MLQDVAITNRVAFFLRSRLDVRQHQFIERPCRLFVPMLLAKCLQLPFGL